MALCSAHLQPEPTLFVASCGLFNYTSPIPLKWDFDLLSLKGVQLMRFFPLRVSDGAEGEEELIVTWTGRVFLFYFVLFYSERWC